MKKILILILLAFGAIGGCGGSGGEGVGSGEQDYVCERDKGNSTSCICTNFSGGMSQICECCTPFFPPSFIACEEVSSSPCPNTSLISGVIDIAFTFSNPPGREYCYVLRTDDGKNIRLVDGPDIIVDDVLFPGASVTLQTTLGRSDLLCKPLSIDDFGEVLDIIEISEKPIPPPELPPLDFVSIPKPISPMNNAIIVQNDPSTGCPFDPVRGYGYKISFDWSDSTSPNGIEKYALTFIRDDKTNISRSAADSEFTEIQCNTFVEEGAIWEWRVRAFDNLDFQSQDSKTSLFEFGPCKLGDGSRCRIP